MKQLFRAMWLEDEGQDLIEYAMLVALIVIAGIVGMQAVGTDIAAIWTNISGALAGAL